MEAPASSSLGAMPPLLRKLDSLLCPDRRLPKPLEDRIELLKEDLEELSAALLEQSMADSPNHKAKYWMDEVRELAYEAEDCIDSMMLTHAGPSAKTRSVHRRHRVRRVKVSRLFRTRKPCTRIAKIAELRALAREASERHERYQLDDFSSNSSRVFTVHSQVPALYGKVGEYLIGIDDARNKLTKGLTGDADQLLKVVCICGSAGIGKTTLARRLYRELGARFECQAFVRASRKPDTRRLLGSILSQVQQRPEPSDSFTVQDLIDNLMKYLHDKRYFIVIDDLWETTTWDIVKSAFPEGNNYSRIITTAESEVIALQCFGYQSDNILEMETLGNHDSAQLFFSIVFGSEHQCPDQLREVSYRIIRKCGGLPLGTIHVAGLLASQTDNSELWHHVQKCLCSNLSTSSTLEEMLKEVLNLCYNSLPYYLKTCLLYLSMYPEGYTMWKVDLLTQWISEGFVTATEENEAEKIAEGYFDELVNRGMIQPEQINHNDEVLSCTVHHTVLDFIMYKSKEGNFITSIDYSQAIIIPSTMVRRLSLHSSSAKYATKMEGVMLSQLRSLFFFGLIRCLPSVVELKLLRVLILEFWGDHYGHTSLNLTRICSLLHLRYLKVSCDIIVELPAQMRGLQFMETLEINARVSAVPLDIIHLPALLHLSLRDEPNLPDGIGQIRSLRTLQYFDLGNNSEGNVLSLGELKNLQDLHLTYSAVQCDERFKRNIVALASSVGKLVNLRSVILVPGALSTPIYHDVSSSVPHPLVFLQSLQKIGLLPPICMFSRLPKCVKQLQKLCYLSIVVRELRRDDMDSVTGLPALTVLSLYVRQPLEQSIIFNTGTFPVLKYFKYMCGVLCLAFQEGALPNLRRLKLGFNAHKAEQYEHFLAGIEHLLNLKEIDGIIGLADGAEEPDRRAAESAFKDAIDKHPRFPSPSYVNVKRVDWIEEEHELRTKVEDSSCEQHEILQKQYGVEVAEEDTENCANCWPTNQIVQKFPENKDLCLNDTQLQDESSARSMNFSSTTTSAQGSQSLSTPSSCWTLYEEYTGVPARSPCPGALSSYVLTPGNIKGPALPYPTSSPEDNILHTQGNWVSPIKTGLSNHPAPKVELSSVAGQWEKGKLIGVGTYGCVYEATDRLTGALCAIKEVNIISSDVESVEFFKQEIKSLSQFKHENIVQFYGSDTIEDRFYIYMEYVHPGSINTYIQQHCGVITESLVCDFTRHILRGLAFLHGRNIMHRNIKGSNMLIDVNGVVKLTDFGVSKHLSIIAPILSLGVGVHWMAPEMVRATLVKDVSCDLAVDIWSLGCTVMEMLNGKPPWSHLEGPAAMFKILNRDPPIPDNLSHEGKDFLQCCFKRNPAERPTATQLLDHPFIQNSSRCSEQQVEEVIAASCEPSFEGKPTAGEANDARPSESSSALQSTPRTIQFNNDRESTLHSESNMTSGHSSGGGEASSSTYFDTPTAKAVPFQLLKNMTDGFSKERIIGKGGFTRVYKGVYENGQVIAVKRYNSSLRLNDNKFENEIQYLMKVHHPNIIQLVGYCMHTQTHLAKYKGKMVCAEIQYKVLCLEYCSNGSLDQHLSDISYGLDWLTRYRIIKGTCEGLRQLHERSSPIIHMDLNPSNIFLGECMIPKIGDFALARVLEDEYSIQTIRMIGTRGYMPPEFIDKQVISIKSDIYSLGVVIIEIMTGQKYHAYYELSIQELIQHVHENWRKRLCATSNDTSVEGYCQQVKKCIKLALSCVEPERLKRPAIGEIIDMLNETETFIHELTLKDKSVLLDVHPVELYFPIEPKKAISCLLQLNNKGSDRVAFMVMAKSQKMYCTKLPFCSVVSPGCSYTIAVTMRKQNQQPPSSIREFFTVQSVAVGDHDLKHVDEDSASVVYDNFFKKVEEMNSDEVQEMTLPVCWDPPAEGTESEPNQSRIEIIATQDSQQVSSVDVHPSEPWIMTTHHGGSLRVWDYQTMATLQSFQVTDEPVHAAKFIEREKWIIAGDGNGCIHVYNYEEKELTSFDAHDSGITSLSVHPTQAVVLSFSHDDHLIKLWDWEKDWECTRTFQGHTNRVTQITFNPNGADSFTSASRDGKVKIWSVHSDGGSPITLDGHDQGLLCVDYFTRRNRQHLITGCMDGTAKIWDLEMDNLEGCVHKLEGHEGRITAVNLHPELPLLITGSLDGTVRLWDSTTYKLENIIGFNLGAVYGFGFIKGLRRLVVGCHQGIAMMEIPSP